METPKYHFHRQQTSWKLLNSFPMQSQNLPFSFFNLLPNRLFVLTKGKQIIASHLEKSQSSYDKIHPYHILSQTWMLALTKSPTSWNQFLEAKSFEKFPANVS